jgi:sec-independent protein translocase protein TatB
MLDIGWSELLVIAVVAIVVIGPKDLPRVMRVIGQWTGRMRRVARDFQNQFNEALKEAELDDLKKSVEEVKKIGADVQKDLAKADSDMRAGMAKTESDVRAGLAASTAEPTSVTPEAAPVTNSIEPPKAGPLPAPEPESEREAVAPIIGEAPVATGDAKP